MKNLLEKERGWECDREQQRYNINKTGVRETVINLTKCEAHELLNGLYKITFFPHDCAYA